MKRILITGAFGFIGGRLVEQLSKQKEKMTLCLIDKKNGFDITNKEQMDNIFRKFNPDCVIHLAATLNCNLLDNIKNNVIGTRNITKLCKKYDVQKIIFSSSAAVYGNNVNALETNYLHPINIYGMAKKYCEKIIKKSGVPYIILRFSNVWGKGGKGVISRLMEDKHPIITSPRFYTRDFVHVSCLCSAIITTINSKIINETINISSGRETMLYSLQQLTEMKIKFKLKKKKEIKFSCLNNGKAEKMLKWKPKITLEKGIKNYERI